jgi:hypothetical protein
VQHAIRNQVALALAVATVSLAACGHGKKEQSAAGSVAPPSSTYPNSYTVPGTSYGAPAASPSTTNIDTTATVKPKHHSKVLGAAVGAAAGHVVGHGAVGAAVGAMAQHERNKKNKQKQ